MTLYNIVTKRLPYSPNIPLPQRLRMEHSNEVFEIYYHKNSFDEHVFLSIKNVSDDLVLFRGRLVNGGLHLIKENTSGLVYFIIYVKGILENDINVRIIDFDTGIEEIEE